jgi:mannose-1-phosphate guanylyltransferase
VTFGVEPERPATEYGYISPGKVIAGEVRSVAKFVEKPDTTSLHGFNKRTKITFATEQYHAVELLGETHHRFVPNLMMARLPMLQGD